MVAGVDCEVVFAHCGCVPSLLLLLLLLLWKRIDIVGADECGCWMAGGKGDDATRGGDCWRSKVKTRYGLSWLEMRRDGSVAVESKARREGKICQR